MKNNKKLTHFDKEGKAIMVDVSQKKYTERSASAKASKKMKKSTFNMVKKGTSKKGDVLGVARIAGIIAAKKTSELIPLCHPLSIASISVDFELLEKTNKINITANCKINAKTGLEMEALTTVSIAALTIYDMCKAVDKEMTISDIKLVYKSGGKSGTYERND